MPDYFTLSAASRRLWTWLQANAVGHAQAVTIPVAASHLGWTARQIQAAAAECRMAGFPVVTEREVRPLGMFIATTPEEVRRYAELLRGIAMPLLVQARKMRHATPFLDRPKATLFG